jgi:hypothetical protein
MIQNSKIKRGLILGFSALAFSLFDLESRADQPSISLRDLTLRSSRQASALSSELESLRAQLDQEIRTSRLALNSRYGRNTAGLVLSIGAWFSAGILVLKNTTPDPRAAKITAALGALVSIYNLVKMAAIRSKIRNFDKDWLESEDFLKAALSAERIIVQAEQEMRTAMQKPNSADRAAEIDSALSNALKAISEESLLKLSDAPRELTGMDRLAHLVKDAISKTAEHELHIMASRAAQGNWVNLRITAVEPTALRCETVLSLLGHPPEHWNYSLIQR